MREIVCLVNISCYNGFSEFRCLQVDYYAWRFWFLLDVTSTLRRFCANLFCPVYTTIRLKPVAICSAADRKIRRWTRFGNTVSFFQSVSLFTKRDPGVCMHILVSIVWPYILHEWKRAANVAYCWWLQLLATVWPIYLQAVVCITWIIYSSCHLLPFSAGYCTCSLSLLLSNEFSLLNIWPIMNVCVQSSLYLQVQKACPYT